MTADLAWDCHVHVIGDPDRFPLSPARGYDPPDAPLESLIAHLDRIGASRAVIVQPSIYGFDNACLLDAIARSEGRCIGVCVPDPGCGIADLQRLHRGGMRGLRCNLLNPGGLALQQTEAWWPWMRDHGWHLQLQLDASRTDLAGLVVQDGLPPVVIDHMGYPARGSRPADIAALIDALAAGQAHVKLSAPYRFSTMPPPYADATDLARALLAAAPDRCLVATDWPHTDLPAAPIPDRAWLRHLQTIAGPDWDRMQAGADRLYGGTAG